MTNAFKVQGFGALSEYNGQFSTAAAAQAFQQMAALGSNSVELTTRIWTDNKTSNDVLEVPAKTESDASLLAGFQAAKSAGLAVVFKPDITGLDGTISSALRPSDVDAFFASYKTEIVHLATVAQQGGVGTFAIGNELSALTGSQYASYWNDIITSVRDVYHGNLTYAAATDEASHVSFWAQLDTIGVNTYAQLTSSTNPSVADLVNAWESVPFNPYYAAAFDYKSPVDFLHSLALEYGKPLLMTEVGYRSIDGAAINPGGGSSNVTFDAQDQADAYNAFMQVWTSHGGTWLKGVEFWQWDLGGTPGANDTGYTVQGKPAQAIVDQYFHGNGTIPGLTVNGSAIGDTIDLGNGNNVVFGGLGHDEIYTGSGNDTIVAGPSTAGKLATTTITITGYGSVVDGVGAQAQILVNGKAVSDLHEFTSATDPSGYQTWTVTFDNPSQITSVDINLANSASGRALHLKDVSINGVDLTPDQATNASSPGTYDLYVRSIHYDTATHQDWFFGAPNDNDVIKAGDGNDFIAGGIGNDIINGMNGVDTAVFSGNFADYTFSHSGTQTVVADSVAARDGTDYLMNTEFMKFADGTYATDTLAKQSDAAVAAATATSPASASDATARDLMSQAASDNFTFAAAPAAVATTSQPVAAPATADVAGSLGAAISAIYAAAGHVDLHAPEAILDAVHDAAAAAQHALAAQSSHGTLLG